MRDVLGKLAALLRPAPSDEEQRQERERVSRAELVEQFEDQRFQRAKTVNLRD